MKFIDCAYAEGAGAGDAPLTWAQSFMSNVIAAADAELPDFDLLLRHDFPEPISLGAAVELLRAFVLRHPVLRMTVAVAPDGTRIQHVRASGVLRVPLCETAPADPERIRDAIAGTSPTQMCQPIFVVAEGLVVGMAMRISHLAADAYGVHLLTEDLAGSLVPDAGDSRTVTPSPIALARFEGSPDGLAVERRAMEFAEAVYSRCPPTMWPRHRRQPEGPRFVYGQLRSSSLLTALDTLTRTRGLGLAGVLVGALAAVAASAAGFRSALLFTISSNRYDSAWRGYPGQLSQEAILHVPVGKTVAQTMRTAAIETMRSFQAARYAPATLEGVRERIGWERGVCFDQLGSAIVLNLVTDGPTPTVDSRNVPGLSTFTWTGSTDQENLGFYLDAFPTATEFVLSARVNTALMAPSEAKEWLCAIEWAIVASASGDVATADLRTRLTVAGEGERLFLAGCENLVASVTGAELVHVRSSPDSDGRKESDSDGRKESDSDGRKEYVCYLFRPSVTAPEEIHKAVMAKLAAAQPAVAPSRYIVVGARPADSSDPSAWSRLPVVSVGSGR